MSLRKVRLLLLVLIALEAALLLFGPQTRDHLPAIEAALAAKQKPEWWDDAAMGVRCAAWINLGLIGLLLLTSHLWSRRASSSIPHPRSSIPCPGWFWPLVVLAVITCMALRLPLASKSLWWDEAWVALQASHGKWRPDTKKPDQLKFMAHDWKRCAFYYQKPTNHVPMALLQKASLLTWQKLTGAKREDFHDLAARVPALLASCAAVMLLAILLRRWSHPGVGIVAAFVLAVHPWHIRYGVDARAYALVVPLCIGGTLAITRLLQTRGASLLPWLCWGAIEFLWLWAYPNALIDVAVLNVITLVMLLREQMAGDRWTICLRFVATHLFAAVCLIQVFLPNVMQARRWAGQEADAHALDASLAYSSLSQLCLGVDFDVAKLTESAGLPSFVELGPGARVAPVLLIAVMLITGGISLWKASRKGACLIVALLGSSVLFALLTRVAGSYFYPRFIIALLPCVVIVAALAFTSSGGESTKWRLMAVVTMLALLVFGPFHLIAQQIHVLLTRPIAPLHDAATFARQQASTPDKPPLVACYGLGREVMPLYEPHCLPVEDAVGLEKVMEQAKAEQRSLFVIQGYNSFNRQLLGSGFKLLDDRARFEEVKAFPGIDPEFYFRVFRMK